MTAALMITYALGMGVALGVLLALDIEDRVHRRRQ